MAEIPTEEQFSQLLVALQETNNEVRVQAEKKYDAFSNDTKFQLLWGVVAQPNIEKDRRIMASVLLRRLFANNFSETFKVLNVETQNQFKSQMLILISQEQDIPMLKKICDIVVEVVNNLIDDDGNNSWPEFLQFLFQSVNGTPTQVIAALTLFSLAPGAFGNQQKENLGLIKSMLARCMESPVQEVQELAAKGVCSFVLLHDTEDSIQKSFQDLLPGILKMVTQIIEDFRDDQVLKSLVDLAETCPKFLRPQLENIMQLTIKYLSNEDVPENFRHLLLEIVVTLAEAAPGMVRKASKYMATLIPQILKMMTELDEEPNWSVSDAEADDDTDSSAAVAESSLDRLACSLSGKVVLPYVNSTILQMLQNEDWKYRHAALMAISAIGEGCHKQMEAMLPQIIELVLRYVSDPHPRVRYASCNAIGQMATDFSTTVPKQFHASLVPGLLHVMDDSENPRVQAHAGAALVNFSEVCPKEILTNYLPTIIGKLEEILVAKFKELMEKGTKLVLEQIVTTIASVADASEEHFLEYYDRFIPCLMYIIENANSTELRLLRGKTIECVSLIGLAVGEEKFMEDAAKMMDILLKAQLNQEAMADDDPQISYLISAWARICKIMGRRFEQYLPLVMGPVIKTAALRPEVALLDNDDMTSIDGDEEWQFVSIGDQQNFGIRTAGLEDKATACQMLVCYARELKEGFAGYTEQVVKLMVPMLKFYFHDGVRSAAAEALPYLLECAKIKGPQYLAEMWSYMCPELMKAVETEPEAEVIAEHMDSLAKCIEVLGAGCINEANMKALCDIIKKTLKAHFERAAKRMQQRTDEDYDEVVEEQLEGEDEEDTYTLSKLTEVTHALFGAYGPNFLPYFDQLLPQFVMLLDPSRTWSEHQWGLCVFDDLVEFCGPSCMPYTDKFLQPMIEFVTDQRPQVRQAACYGCGILAQFGGAEFAPVCSQVLPRLIQIIGAPKSREEENVLATENAISAVNKILKYNNSQVNVNEIIPLWLTWLPISEDLDEAFHVYGYLCDLIDSNNPLVLGPDNANLAKLIALFAETFKSKVVEKDSEIAGRMLNIVRQLQANPSMFDACISQLSHEQQMALHNFLSA